MVRCYYLLSFFNNVTMKQWSGDVCDVLYEIIVND